MHIGKQYFYLFVYSQLRVYIKCIRKYLFGYMFKTVADPGFDLNLIRKYREYNIGVFCNMFRCYVLYHSFWR